MLFKIAKRIKYPEYTSKSKYNDIALLRLDTEVVFNEYIHPACLPEYSSITFRATATGWGQTASNQPPSPHLLKAELSLLTHRDCNALYSKFKDRKIKFGIVNDSQMCAGPTYKREDTCPVKFKKEEIQMKHKLKISISG